MTTVGIAEEWLKAGEALRLFEEIYGDKIPEHVFYHMASPTVCKVRVRLIRNEVGKLKRRYSRSDVVSMATERKKTKGLIPIREGWRRLVNHGLPRVKEEHFTKLVVKERQIPILHSNDIAHWVNPYDVDALAEKLKEGQEKEQALEDLMTTAEAVEWINKELERQGSTRRVAMLNIYKWVDRGSVIPDGTVPGVASSKFATYRFSEETLRNAPPFRA